MRTIHPMHGFLYFVPSATHSATLVDEFGLRYAIERSPNFQPVRSGPGGVPGVIISDAKHVPRSANRFKPDDQTWTERHEKDGVWIGHPLGVPPALSTLGRSVQLPGQYVELHDGSAVHIPHARRWSDSVDHAGWVIGLPMSLGRDEDGLWIRKDVVGRYRRLWDLVVKYIDTMEAAISRSEVDDGESVWFEFPEINELAIAGIAANYRVGPDEVEITGQFDEGIRSRVIDVLTDKDTRDAWVKKKLLDLTAAGGNSSVGLEDSITESTVDTLPPSPISMPTASASTDNNEA